MTSPNETNDPEERCERRVLCAGYQGREGSFGARAAAISGRPVALPTFSALLAALVSGEVDEAATQSLLMKSMTERVGPLGMPSVQRGGSPYSTCGTRKCRALPRRKPKLVGCD